MNTKRIKLFCFAIIAMLCGIVILPARLVDAKESEKTGYWEYVKSWDEQSDSLTVEGYNYKEVIRGSASAGFRDKAVITGDGYRMSGTNLEDRLHEGTCKGEFGEAVFTFSPLPGSLRPEEELAITANVSCRTSGHHVGVGGQVMIDRCSSSPDSNDYVYFRQKSDNAYVIAPTQVWQSEGKRSGGHSDLIGDNTGTFYVKIPKGRDWKSNLYIRFHFVCKSTRIDSIYQYKWVDTTFAAETKRETEDDQRQVVSVTESNPEITVTPEPTNEQPFIVQIEEENAEENTGEDYGTHINPGIVTGQFPNLPSAALISVLGAAAAAAALSGKSEEKKQPVYAMRLYKEFGDTITRGENVVVYARIVERTADGEKECPEMTRKIRIGSPDDVFVVEMQEALAGSYKAARVYANDNIQNKNEGCVDFRYDGKGGIFVKRVKFKLDTPLIKFYQDNIALPARYEETGEIGFTVEGLDLQKIKVKVEMPKKSSYETKVVQAVTEEGQKIPGTYFAILADINADTGEAGSYAEETLTVTATDGKHTVTGEMPVYRVNVGLRIGVNSLNCYRSLKPEAAGKHVNDLEASDFEVSFTKVPAMVLKVDMENHEMYYEPANAIFEICPINPEDTLMQERLDGIGLDYRLTSVGESIAEYTFICTKGWLEPPLRARVLLRASAETEDDDGEICEYRCEKEIVLLSQKKREKIWQGDLDKDYQLSLWLDDTRAFIRDNDFMDDLGGDYMLMATLWESYDERFGYDPILVAQIQYNITECLKNRRKYYLKKKQEYNLKLQDTARADDNVWTAVSKSFAMVSDNYLDTWGGMAVRMAAGFCTGGLSEIAFTAMDVNKAVSEYNEKTLLCDRSTGGKLLAGSAPIILSATMSAGAYMVGYSAKTLGKEIIALVPQQTKSAFKTMIKGKFQAGLKKIPKEYIDGAIDIHNTFKGFTDKINSYDPRKRMFGVKNAAATTDAELMAARKAAQKNIMEVRRGGLSKKNQFKSIVEEAGELKAARNVDRFKKAADRRLVDFSEAAEREFNGAFDDVMQDTFTLRKLNCDGKTAEQIAGKAQIKNPYIAAYNDTKAILVEEPMEKLIKKKGAKIASKKLGRVVTEDEIILKRASGKTQAQMKEGYCLSFDMDNSPMIVDKNTGKATYFTLAESNDMVATSYCEARGIKYSNLTEAMDKAGTSKIVSVTPEHPEYYMQFDRLKGNKAFDSWAMKANIETGKFKMKFEYDVMEAKINNVLKDANRAAKIESECRRYLNREISELSEETLQVMSCVEKQCECLHQTPKTFDLYMNKDIQARAVTGVSGFSQNSRVFAETCRYAENQGTYKLTMGQMEEILERQGTNYSKMVDRMANEFASVNANISNANGTISATLEKRFSELAMSFRPVSQKNKEQ